MTRKVMIAGAAIAGLMSGSFAVTAHAVQSSSKAGGSLKMGDQKDAQEKHACAGKNSCKGQGRGGKNSCKGKGTCATDGSDLGTKPAESPADDSSQPAESPAE